MPRMGSPSNWNQVQVLMTITAWATVKCRLANSAKIKGRKMIEFTVPDQVPMRSKRASIAKAKHSR
jgi:hypothetical protein